MTKRKTLGVIICLAVVLLFSIEGTLAWLTAETGEVKNVFKPTEVDCEITEEFDGSVKKNVNVTNTGNINAYIRVRLVTYRVNAAGDRIGGTATIPSFTPGAGWIEGSDGYYYYANPVAPGNKPAAPLIGSTGITLQTYTDADGGRQVIEVIAEAIQAEGFDATAGKHPVELAWGVKVNNGTSADYSDDTISAN